ncbi:PAS domain-containing protein [Rugamonas sp. FT82W]|uniref:PAS domain-containing protein n=1 Tax=Duganella vulcania TaxID=2692166 RepID=A0A845GDQ7_9BURK|nr:PAS domain-containing protein [Duganella vulcania]MYM91690.1 PAS domain-containing protein [Duganella vulcania]
MTNLIDSLGKSEIDSMFNRIKTEIGNAAPDGELHALIAAMPAALFIKDAQSRVLLMNPACEALWGIPFDAMRGNDGAAFFPAEQTAYFLKHDRIAFDSGEYTVYEEDLWHAGLGENRRLETHKQATYDEQGQPNMLIAMCVDITDRKRAED